MKTKTFKSEYIESGKVMKVLKGLVYRINDIAFSKDGAETLTVPYSVINSTVIVIILFLS